MVEIMYEGLRFMNDADLRKEQAARAMKRFYAKRGDMRTLEKRNADVKQWQSYTPEEAERIIQGIMSSSDTFFPYENSDGTCGSYTKEEMIAYIKAMIKG